MKYIITFVIGLVSTIVIANATSQTLNSSATIKSSLSFAVVTDLNFGTITSGTTTSDITLAATGVTTVPSGDATVGTDGTAGTYTLQGSPSTNVTVSVAPSGTLIRTSGTETLTAAYAVQLPTVALDATGKGTVIVTGSIGVPSAAEAGAYTGTFLITYAY